VTGLVHISEIADNYVKDVNDHLKVNDPVTVKVINVDKDGKIGLSIRKAVDKPAPERVERPVREGGFQRREHGDNRGPRGAQPKNTFDDKLTRFLKDSEERISSLKKNTESKRGGRGAKRS
jgi:S1 RNA binding domain protein